MMRNRKYFAGTVLAAALVAGSPAAAPAATERYVGDELVLVLRQGPSADAAGKGTVNSGTRIEVLETDKASGYAKVKTSDGREGWLLDRYLQAQPPVRDRLPKIEKQLAETQAELKKAQGDYAKLKEEHDKMLAGRPPAAPEVVLKENETLQAEVKEYRAENERLTGAYDAESATQRTLLIGGGLVAGGFVLALLLHWLWPRKRSDW
jgi:SH3 domain protein